MSVLQQHVKKKLRVKVMEYWIETARECFNIGNFNSLMAIIAGLNMSPISRLKKTVSQSQILNYDFPTCLVYKTVFNAYSYSLTLLTYFTYLFTYLLYLLIYLIACLLTYLLTPWSRVLLEKLTGLQLVKQFHAFCGTRKFITAFTSARHLSLSWARSIESTS